MQRILAEAVSSFRRLQIDAQINQHGIQGINIINFYWECKEKIGAKVKPPLRVTGLGWCREKIVIQKAGQGAVSLIHPSPWYGEKWNR